MSSEFLPIAIVGIGCRLPGGCNSPHSFWRLLEAGGDAVALTPDDRWNLDKFYSPDQVRLGKTQSKWGGYVDGIDRFDPQLFGISPREAACMDPQQRMLLETAYRATEDAGVPIESIAGQSVSVHVGISSIDHSVALLSSEDPGVIGPYSNTGGSSSIAANRISYCFDLRGESVAVDTACSSSLIATHLACQSLQDRSNTMALAGGVNALLLPDFFVAFSQLGVLSPDGRCKTFDASANGYVRGEGAGMVLLKRLDDAIANDDDIYAVIHGSATNQDGRTDGITVPSQTAQEQLIQTALDVAGISPRDVSYVEAHGTGTPLGDPIEARAIANSYGRQDGVCHIGSVKTNIGHLEAGAGIASLIKVALAVKHRKIPAHLNLETLHPQIDFQSCGMQVPRKTEDWKFDGIRLAGINGFGYGGANAHLILGQAIDSDIQESERIAPDDTSHNDASPRLLPVSAHGKKSLAATASRWADWLELNDASMTEIASTASCRRSHHDWRAAVVGSSHREWIEQLRHLSSDPDSTAKQIHPSRRTRNPSTNPRIAFVFSGQGPQWWAMGRGLLKHEPVFRQAIERCDREFAKYVTWSLIEELLRDEGNSRMMETSIAQPSLFAVQVALTALWESKGIRPAILVGHSVGEIAAAHLAGSLSFHDACCVAIHRGRTMDLASSRGAMLAVGLSAEEAQPWIEDVRDRVSIAAINSPTSLTLSGCETTIAQLHRQLDEEGVFCRRLQVEYAFHSPQMDPVRSELLRSLAGIKPTETHTELISTVTGNVVTGDELDGHYWWNNVRQGVRFADAMGVMAQQGIELAIEVGPHPVLGYSISECFSAHDRSILTLASLNRKTEDRQQIADSIGRLYCWGYPVDWELNDVRPLRPIRLPALVMDKTRLWSESFATKRSRLAEGYDPILGDRVDGPIDAWQIRVDLRIQKSLADHRVRNSCVMPAAAMLRYAATAGTLIQESEAVSLVRFRMLNPCLLSDDSPVRLQVSYDANRARLSLAQSDVGDSDWQVMATTDLSDCATVPRGPSICLAEFCEASTESVTSERLYRHCEELGLNYGPRYRGVVSGHRKRNEAIVSIELPESSDSENVSGPLGFGAEWLDSCFHAMIVADPDFDQTVRGLYLPNQIESIDVFSKASSRLTAHARIIRKDDFRMVADIDVYDQERNHCIAIRGFESTVVSGTSQRKSIDQLLYRSIWKPSERVESFTTMAENRKWLVFADQIGLASEIIERFPIADDLIMVQHGTAFKRLRNNSFIIDPENREHFDRLLMDIGDGVTDVVYLWGLDSPDNVELSQEVLEKSGLLTTLAPMHLVAAWQRAAESKTQSTVARLSIVTRDAQPPDETLLPIAIAAAPLIGLGRVIVSECGRLKTKLVDMTSTDSTVQDDLVRELLQWTDDEDEVMYRDSIRWVRRFVPASDQPLHRENDKRIPCVLRSSESASIDQLRYEAKATASLSDSQIEIEIVATGLNFSDVMKALDLYPGLPDGPALMGAECSGRVSRVGAAVTAFVPGDEVVAIAPGAFATHVVVDQCLVARKPRSLSHEQAATIPIAFLTADYALNECARIRSGDRVLIHSASGGVGIAATQLALTAGATVFATAGTEVKREYVRRHGAELVMDSRTLEFAPETLRYTDGQGIDVILNSLPGQAITKGLSILKTGGRFLEIGKRDIYSDASLGLEPFQNNLALFAIDLDQLFREQPDRMGKMLRDLVVRFENGELSPLPVKRFDADETQNAFRFMQQAKHIGKVVVDYRNFSCDVFAGQSDSLHLKSDRTYWVAGGLGGFGKKVAEWLIDRGAKHLVLGGRSTIVDPEDQPTLNQWSQQGIDVRIMPVDLSSSDSVESVVAQIDAQCPPLAGVFHTAMILEDRLIADLDRNTLQRVLRPKVQGGWNLHAATSQHDLEYFILFSSLSSVFGHAGQANYSAANAFLDSLAHYRRSLGMPGLVINWGHVGEVGYLSQRSELSERLERQGVLRFSAAEAMACMERLIGNQAIQQSVLRMDWTRWRGLGITGDVSLRFAHLLRGKPDQTSSSERLATASEVRSAVGDARAAMINNIVCRKVSALLGIEVKSMQWNRSLLSMGLDSLMAVEIRNWIESRLEIDLPIADLMRSESLLEVCRNVTRIVDTSLEKQKDSDAVDLLDRLPEMSDASVDSLLTQMLNESKGEQPGG